MSLVAAVARVVRAAWRTADVAHARQDRVRALEAILAEADVPPHVLERLARAANHAAGASSRVHLAACLIIAATHRHVRTLAADEAPPSPTSN